MNENFIRFSDRWFYAKRKMIECGQTSWATQPDLSNSCNCHILNKAWLWEKMSSVADIGNISQPFHSAQRKSIRFCSRKIHEIRYRFPFIQCAPYGVCNMLMHGSICFYFRQMKNKNKLKRLFHFVFFLWAHMKSVWEDVKIRDRRIRWRIMLHIYICIECSSWVRSPYACTCVRLCRCRNA